MAQLNDTERIEMLNNVIDAESTLANCCAHLSFLIHNGKIRQKFNQLANIARENIKTLHDYMRSEQMPPAMLENRCKYCKMKPESFSLEGAVSLGLELVSVCEALYKNLAKLATDRHSKTLFEELRKDKAAEKNFLKSEKKFIKEEKPSSCIINEYCIPEIASKFWK
jgi:rubrerythrin